MHLAIAIAPPTPYLQLPLSSGPHVRNVPMYYLHLQQAAAAGGGRVGHPPALTEPMGSQRRQHLAPT